MFLGEKHADENVASVGQRNHSESCASHLLSITYRVFLAEALLCTTKVTIHVCLVLGKKRTQKESLGCADWVAKIVDWCKRDFSEKNGVYCRNQGILVRRCRRGKRLDDLCDDCCVDKSKNRHLKV